MSKSERYTGSGNVFLDLGFDETKSEELLVKAHLFHKLQDAIRATKMTQVEVANMLGTDQSKVSKILRGQMSQFSIDRITSYLLNLGWNVHVDARPGHARTGKGRAVFGQGKSVVARGSKPITRIAAASRKRPAKANDK